MDRDEKLKLDYEQTTKYYHQLADSRFKLLTSVTEEAIADWHY